MDKIANQVSATKSRSVEFDVLSRYHRVQPMKNRFATTVKNGFLKILNIDDPLSRLKYGYIKKIVQVCNRRNLA